MCSKCRKEWPATTEYFPPDKAKRSGLASWCRSCKREQQRVYNTRVRPRPHDEIRDCKRDTCPNAFTWTSEHPEQRYCSKRCWEWDNRVQPPVRATRREALALTCDGCHRFLQANQFHRNKYKIFGRQDRCKDCQRLRYVQDHYGLDRDQALLAMRPGPCEICAEWVEVPDVDHCHKSGKFRGLLCNRHNRALGLFQDNVEHLRAAAAYLERKP